jgi:hypothetical protein
MTRVELRQLVRDLLAEPDTTGFYTDEMINRMINMAYKEFARETKSIHKVAQVSVTVNTREYGLPSDFLDPLKVQVHTGELAYRLRPVHFRSVKPDVDEAITEVGEAQPLDFDEELLDSEIFAEENQPY